MTAQLVVVPSIQTGADRRTSYGFVFQSHEEVAISRQVLEATTEYFRDFMSQPRYSGYVSEVTVVLTPEPQVLVTGIVGQSVVEFMQGMDYMMPGYLRAAFKRARGLEPGTREDFHFPEDAVVYQVGNDFYLEYGDAVQALRRV